MVVCAILGAFIVPCRTVGADAAHRFSIRFDYRFDKNGFFDDAQKQTLEAAAAAWSEVLTSDFPEVPEGTRLTLTNPESGRKETVILKEPIDDLLIFVFAYDMPDRTMTASGTPVGTWTRGDAFDKRYNRSPFQPWIARISFDTKGERPWFFDQTPATWDDVPMRTHRDFMTAAMHEIGHALGLIQLKKPFAFSNLVVRDAFTGKKATAANGGAPVPLTKESGHLADGFGAGLPRPHLMRDLMHHDAAKYTTRVYPSALDLALLEDIGYGVNPAGVRASPYGDKQVDPRVAAYRASHPELAGEGAKRFPRGLWFFDDVAFLNQAVLGAPVLYLPATTGNIESIAANGGVNVPAGASLLFDVGGDCAGAYTTVTDVRHESGKWHRVVNVVDVAGKTRAAFEDGVARAPAAAADCAAQALQGPLDVKRAALFDYALSDAEVSSLGDATREIAAPTVSATAH